MERRVTFQEVPAHWTGWENPFQPGSDLRVEAEQILSLWREGTLYQCDGRQSRQGDHRDQDLPEDSLVTADADIKLKQKENKKENSSKLYKRFLKWKVKLIQNFIKVR